MWKSWSHSTYLKDAKNTTNNRGHHKVRMTCLGDSAQNQATNVISAAAEELGVGSFHFQVKNYPAKHIIVVLVSRQKLTMEVESGAAVSILSDFFLEVFPG